MGQAESKEGPKAMYGKGFPGISATPDFAEELGGRIGPYKLLSVLGEGGFGLVYLAEQVEPIRRHVALKIIKPGMDSKQIITRFETERETLAVLDHPNIAHIFEAGTTETHRPYFVMEYVKGVPITEYCDSQKLTIHDRLRLFLQVCDAIQYAHEKGIIHRDIKPSNVLVTTGREKGVPIIIDFGVAKATAQMLSGHTRYTAQGQMIGTPEYMSPEQATMGVQEVDTRSDIYSLGVLLYEMLSGVLPFRSEDLHNVGPTELQKTILETEPPRPSTRLTELKDESKQLAQDRSTNLNTLVKTLRNELEWIPLKAIRKERIRRYRSVSELADDIRHYLDGKPLIAGPESALYRARKFFERNTVLVSSVGIVLVLLIAGIVVSTILAAKYSKARTDAVLAAQEVKSQKAEAEKQANLAIQNEQDAKRAAAEAIKAKADADEQRKMALEALDQARRDQQEKEKALNEANRAGREAIFQQKLAEERTAEALNLRLQAEEAKAEAEASQREAERQAKLAQGTLDFLNASFFAIVDQIKSKGEGVTIRDVLDAASARLNASAEGEPLVEASLRTTIGNTYLKLGVYQAAEPHLERALKLRTETLGSEDPQTLVAKHNLASLYAEQNRGKEAKELMLETLAAKRRVFGEDHSETLSTMNNLASLYMADGLQQDWREAEQLLTTILAVRRSKLGEKDAGTLRSMGNLASFYQYRGRSKEAEELYKQALEGQITILGEEHPDTLTTKNNLGFLLYEQGELEVAESLLLAAVEGRTHNQGADHPETATSMYNLGLIYQDQGCFGEAWVLFNQVLVARTLAFGEQHDQTKNCAERLIGLQEQWERYKSTKPEAETQDKKKPGFLPFELVKGCVQIIIELPGAVFDIGSKNK